MLNVRNDIYFRIGLVYPVGKQSQIYNQESKFLKKSLVIWSRHGAFTWTAGREEVEEDGVEVAPRSGQPGVLSGPWRVGGGGCWG